MTLYTMHFTFSSKKTKSKKEADHYFMPEIINIEASFIFFIENNDTVYARYFYNSAQKCS